MSDDDSDDEGADETKEKEKNKDISDDDSGDEGADDIELPPTDSNIIDASDTKPTCTPIDVENFSNKVASGSDDTSGTETEEDEYDIPSDYLFPSFFCFCYTWSVRTIVRPAGLQQIERQKEGRGDGGRNEKKRC